MVTVFGKVSGDVQLLRAECVVYRPFGLSHSIPHNTDSSSSIIRHLLDWMSAQVLWTQASISMLRSAGIILVE